jgi:sphinganine-1-phosphate aldolase
MFSTKELRKGILFNITNWPGGMYATTSIAGSRNGSIIAANWASLMRHGKEGFLKKAKNILEAAAELRKAIAHIPDL